MSKTLSSEFDTSKDADTIRPVFLVRLDFDTGVVAANSSQHNITYSGQDYLGVGLYGSISAINEKASIGPAGIQVSLSAIDPTYTSLLLTDNYRGRPAYVYLGLLDEGYNLIADPILYFEGRMDYAVMSYSAESAHITIAIENNLADWDRPRVRRFNDRDQQAEYPGDLGFQYVEKTIDKTIVWGKA